jgi:hypothetical protein
MFLIEICTFSGLHCLHRISVSPMISNPKISGQLDQFSYRNSMMFLFEFHQFRYLNSSQLISTHMRTMVLEYLPTKLAHVFMGQMLGFRFQHHASHMGSKKSPWGISSIVYVALGWRPFGPRQRCWRWQGGPVAWQRLAGLHGFTMVYHGLAPRKKCIFLDISWYFMIF